MSRFRTALADYTPDVETYGPGSAAFSPGNTGDAAVGGIPELGLPSEATQQQSPNASTQQAGTKGTSQVGDSPPPIPYVVTVPRPPLPSTGGMPGRAMSLGYTTGILPSRATRMPFTGKVIVAPSMGAHPVDGPVGFSNRQGRLASGVAALVDQWLPSQQQVNEDVVNVGSVSPRNRNPLGG